MTTEQVRQRGKIGRITGLAYATPAPVSHFRSRQPFWQKKKKIEELNANGQKYKTVNQRRNRI